MNWVRNLVNRSKSYTDDASPQIMCVSFRYISMSAQRFEEGCESGAVLGHDPNRLEAGGTGIVEMHLLI
jgi:hypothetical protein